MAITTAQDGNTDDFKRLIDLLNSTTVDLITEYFFVSSV